LKSFAITRFCKDCFFSAEKENERRFFLCLEDDDDDNDDDDVGFDLDAEVGCFDCFEDFDNVRIRPRIGIFFVFSYSKVTSPFKKKFERKQNAR